MAGETISFNQINWKLKVSHEIEGYTLILGEIKGQQRHLCCADVLFDYNSGSDVSCVHNQKFTYQDACP